jgi:hypothetical protein
MKAKNKAKIYAGVLLIVGLFLFPTVSATELDFPIQGENMEGNVHVSLPDGQSVTVTVTSGDDDDPPYQGITKITSRPVFENGWLCAAEINMTYYYNNHQHVQYAVITFCGTIGEVTLFFTFVVTNSWFSVDQPDTVPIVIPGHWKKYSIHIAEDVDNLPTRYYDFQYPKPHHFDEIKAVPGITS